MNVGENRAKMLIYSGLGSAGAVEFPEEWNMTVWLHSREERVTHAPNWKLSRTDLVLKYQVRPLLISLIILRA